VLNRWPLVLTAAVIYMLLAAVYMIVYVSTELMSPSKKILQVIAQGQSRYADIYKALERENFIMLRLEELEHSGCLCRRGEHYQLTASGKGIADVLKFYQCVLGREAGG
jgi:predicted transcriptional regulator